MKKSQVQIAALISLFFLTIPCPLSATYVLTPATTILGNNKSVKVKNFWVDGYSFQLNEQCNELIINLTSRDFDPYLIVIPPDGQIIIDDDSGGGYNSELTLTNLVKGTWRVLVTSSEPCKQGLYILSTTPTTKFAKDTEYVRSCNLLIDIFDRPRDRPRHWPPRQESVQPMNTGGKIVCVGAVVQTHLEDQLHSLPWPPPQASATADIPMQLLFSDSQISTGVLLSHVDRRLTQALRVAGYTEFSYYRIPDGFAIVTRIEQINIDGTPLNPPARWSIDISPLNRFSLHEYLRALFAAKSGYFRVIVFTVTSHPFIQSEYRVSRSEALLWLRSGFNVLPQEIGEIEHTQQHRVTALVYEFEKPRAAPKAAFLIPGRMDGSSHLYKAGITNALER